MTGAILGLEHIDPFRFSVIAQKAAFSVTEGRDVEAAQGLTRALREYVSWTVRLVIFPAEEDEDKHQSFDKEVLVSHPVPYALAGLAAAKDNNKNTTSTLPPHHISAQPICSSIQGQITGFVAKVEDGNLSEMKREAIVVRLTDKSITDVLSLDTGSIYQISPSLIKDAFMSNVIPGLVTSLLTPGLVTFSRSHRLASMRILLTHSDSLAGQNIMATLLEVASSSPWCFRITFSTMLARKSLPLSSMPSVVHWRPSSSTTSKSYRTERSRVLADGAEKEDDASSWKDEGGDVVVDEHLHHLHHPHQQQRRLHISLQHGRHHIPSADSEVSSATPEPPGSLSVPRQSAESTASMEECVLSPLSADDVRPPLSSTMSIGVLTSSAATVSSGTPSVATVGPVPPPPHTHTIGDDKGDEMEDKHELNLLVHETSDVMEGVVEGKAHDEQKQEDEKIDGKPPPDVQPALLTHSTALERLPVSRKFIATEAEPETEPMGAPAAKK
ncbi:hypothetical protein BJ165DRAFT_1533990 [Panaeolus papilionaceus]|nr:hypothetical protein BJ165DRAFT_1533990 [Panaeolus papilionaceus]